MTRRRAPIHPFDIEHGTNTGTLIPAEKLSTGHRSDRHITAYHGVAPSLFIKLMARWQDGLAKHPIEKTNFLDIGAGKGRAMLLASDYPFRRIIGCELHPMLAAVARENIDDWHDASRMTLIEDDVMRMRFPVGPCAAFFFNPFDAIMMDRFLTRLGKAFASRPGELDLLYINDEQRDIITQEHPKFKQLWRGRIFLSRIEAAADREMIEYDAKGMYVTSGYEDCSIYRLMKR